MAFRAAAAATRGGATEREQSGVARSKRRWPVRASPHMATTHWTSFSVASSLAHHPHLPPPPVQCSFFARDAACSVYFKCFRRILYVAKVDLNVTMLHMFHTHIACVLSGCCIFNEKFECSMQHETDVAT